MRVDCVCRLLGLLYHKVGLLVFAALWCETCSLHYTYVPYVYSVAELGGRSGTSDEGTQKSLTKNTLTTIKVSLMTFAE